MKYFMIEGTILDADIMTDEIMKEHMAYTQKAMDDGTTLISGLKTDMSGGVFIMSADSTEKIESYLSHEPFKIHGIQEYRIIEFDCHYFNPGPAEFFRQA